MENKFIPKQAEEELYRFWETSGIMTGDNTSKKKPFTIILPPPNANADLHLGHAMYVYEDIMIRFHKLLGFEVLWLPGADHAGFETQYVFEKHLAKKGESRFKYDRSTLYRMIWDFVHENRPRMENQLRRLGFFLDWSRNKFTLDQDIIKIVYQTFKKLFDDGLVYRSKRLVNYCTRDGTSFSDLEIKYVERKDPLYYIKYGPFVLATVRPETKFGDTALAVHPKDKRYKKWIGKEVEAEGLLGKFKIKVIADESVDPKFGTGVVKITPAHDFNDFETGKRHSLPMKQVIGFDGRLNELTGSYAGLKVKKAREIIVEDLKKKGLIEKIDEDYTHRVATCYKCGSVIEPLPLEQLFVKIRPLADQAIGLINKKKIRFFPLRFKKTAIQWLTNFHDWNISRQIVWGIRIPAWKCSECGKWTVTEGKIPNACSSCKSANLRQDDDTFDTWFSSSQWPFATLKTAKKGDFEFFYPTSVMETGYEILPWWIVRMIMMGYFVTKQEPFKNVFLHGMVRDKKGQKMSKSKGNVVNPLEMVDKYGADALRANLIFGVAEGNDQALSEEKIIGMRNFANKIWNIGRFIHMNKISNNQFLISKQASKSNSQITKQLIKESEEEKKQYLKSMKAYKFSQALGLMYEFLWHRFADYYIEELKEELKNGNIEVLEVLKSVYFDNLKMIHPFMPFVTEAVWQTFNGKKSSILLQMLKS